MSIVYKGKSQTIVFACNELEKYLKKMNAVQLVGVIALGEYSDFDNDSYTPESEFDDEVTISVKNGTGIVSGVNERSVLLAVYRYLKELGCRFIFPGRDGQGEYIPTVDSIDCQLTERPSYRHRGIDLASAYRCDNFYDIIDWMPKNMLNSIFTETREGLLHFAKWYKHTENPVMESEFFSRARIEHYAKVGREMAKKRGLIFHVGGHGWTSEPFGVPVFGSDLKMAEFPDFAEKFPNYVEHLALIEGKRQLRPVGNYKPFDSNACYGNPKTREIMIEDALFFVKSRPDVDVMHLWLGDSINTQCECDLCKDTLPADFYVQMLNELDARMTAENIKTKIVFLLYFDLLWPPIKERLNNQDRFILMFAPISRTYSEAFEMKKDLPEIDPFVRNKLESPKSPAKCLSYLNAWQDLFKGDGFCFDYHLIWDHFKDPGYMALSKVLHKDLQNIQDLGLNGVVNCWQTRAFFPTGFMMHLLGEVLWNREIEYEDVSHKYFTDVYGDDGMKVMEYLEKLSELFNPKWLRNELTKVSNEQAKKLEQIPAVIAAFSDTISSNLKKTEISHQKIAYYILKRHAEYCLMLQKALLYLAKGDFEKMEGQRTKFLEFAGSLELDEKIQPYFDFKWLHQSNYGMFSKGDN